MSLLPSLRLAHCNSSDGGQPSARELDGLNNAGGGFNAAEVPTVIVVTCRCAFTSVPCARCSQ